MGFTDLEVLDCGCIGRCCCVSQFDQEQYERDLHRKYKKIAEQYGGDDVAIVGYITDKRINFSENRLYVKMESPVREEGLTGKRVTEGYLEGDVVSLMAVVHSGSYPCMNTAVTDKTTGKLIALLDNV